MLAQENPETGPTLHEKLMLTRRIAYGVFKKYIAVGSELEINLHYRTRRKLQYNMEIQNQWISQEIPITKMSSKRTLSGFVSRVYTC